MMHFNTIFTLFTLLAVPLWALPLHNDQAIIREYMPRDVIPTSDGVLQDRSFFSIGAKIAGKAFSHHHHRWVHLFDSQIIIPNIINGFVALISK